MQFEYQVPMTSRRARTVKKTSVKKKLIALVVVLGVLLTSAQVVAATLGTDILAAIQQGIAAMGGKKLEEVDSAKLTIQNQNVDNVKISVDGIKTNAGIDLANYTAAELQRARLELDTYLKSKNGDIDAAVKEQTDKSKIKIKENVDAIIVSIKAAMDTKYQNELTTGWPK